MTETKMARDGQRAAMKARLAGLQKKATETPEFLTAAELGELADIHKSFAVERLQADKYSEALKEIEVAAEQLLIVQMRAQGVSAAGGKVLTVKLNPVKNKPQVTDWGALYNHIIETGDFSFLQRRVGEAAVTERWEDGQAVPGVDKFPVYTLSKSVIK